MSAVKIGLMQAEKMNCCDQTLYLDFILA